MVVEEGNSRDIGRVFNVGQEAVVIGRPAVGNDPDIPLHDDYVSRRHAEISYRDGCFVLRDLGSRNNTRVDGVSVEPGEFHPLKDNSIIEIAIVGRPRVVLRFKASDDTAPGTKPTIDVAKLVDWIKLDMDSKEAWVDGKLLRLSRKEYTLLSMLYQKAGKVCSKDEIIAQVWPEARDPGAVSDAAVEQLVRRLRTKIERDPSRPSRIISKKGFGYVLSVRPG